MANARSLSGKPDDAPGKDLRAFIYREMFTFLVVSTLKTKLSDLLLLGIVNFIYYWSKVYSWWIHATKYTRIAIGVKFTTALHSTCMSQVWYTLRQLFGPHIRLYYCSWWSWTAKARTLDCYRTFIWITDLYYFEIDLICVIHFYIQLLGLNEALGAGIKNYP